MKTIEKIIIEHSKLGQIEIHPSLPDKVNDLIGTITNDYSNDCFYFADIVINENETITIKQLRVIKPETVTVGHMITGKGSSKSFITVYMNVMLDTEIVCYPKTIISIYYNIPHPVEDTYTLFFDYYKRNK